MNQICRRADKVTIWLGKITDRDQIQRGADIGKVYAQVATRQVLGIVEGQELLDINNAHSEPLERHGLPALTQRDADAIISVYRSRWLHRRWILQEVALAREAEVLWGDISVPWDDLGMVATFLQLSSLAAELNFRFSGNRSSIQELDAVGDGFLGAMRDMMDFLSGVSGMSVSVLLLQLVLWTRVTFRASDQRDCVYVFQGILNHLFSDEKILKELQADYDIPTAELMIRFTAALLRKAQSLYVLGLVRNPSEREISGTSSWVPDLSPSASVNPKLWPCLKSAVAGESLFNMSAGTRHGFPIQSNKPYVHGRKVGIVQVMGEELDEALHGRFQGWAELMLAMDPTYEPTGRTRGDTFRRAVVLDQDESRRLASSEVLNKVSQIITWIIFSAARREFETKTLPGVHEFLNDHHFVFQAAAEVQDCLLLVREVVEAACIKYGMLPQTEKSKILHDEEKQLWLRDFHSQASSRLALS